MDASKPLRLLHVDAGREMRGGQWQTLALCQGLMAKGHAVTLLADKRAPLFAAAAEASVPVFALSLAALRQGAGGVDLTHVHDAHAHTQAVLVNTHPLVVSRRVAFPVRQGWLSRWKYRRAERYIAVSQAVARELERAAVPAEKIRVVYDGVALPAKLSQGTTVYGLLSDDPAKGGALMREVQRLCSVPIRLTSDLRADLPSAGLFVYVTASEGLGSAALVAMSYGVPVVASRVGGLPEIVQDGLTGITVPNDPTAIASAVEKLIGDPACLRRFGTAARHSVETRFTTDHMVNSALQIYREISP